MAQIGTITLTLRLDPASRAAAEQSVGSLAEVFAQGLPEHVARLCPRLFERGGNGGVVLRDDFADLLVRELILDPATGAGEAQILKILPPDWYGEFMAAIAAHGDLYGFGWVHGWPVLSLGCDSASMAEADGANNPVGGGLADA